MNSAATASSSSTPRRVAAIGCAALILLFGVLSYSAVRNKSATYDEPLHLLSAWLQLHLSEFRLDFENPPLSKYFASLPNGADAILFNPADPNFKAVSSDLYKEWDVTRDTLYFTPINDSVSLLNRARFMMTILAMGLGVMLTIWAWQLGGPIAAIIACTLFAFDPNLLGHGSLMKNDVPFSLMMIAIFCTCMHVGRRLTWGNGLLLCGLIGLAMSTKFSALLLGPMLILLLAIRVFVIGSWSVLGRELSRISSRLLAAGILMLAIGISSWALIWTCYQFHFGPSRDPSVVLSTAALRHEYAYYRFRAATPHPRPAPFDPAAPLADLSASLEQHLAELDASINQAADALVHAKDLNDEVRQQIQASIDEGRIGRRELASEQIAPATQPSSRPSDQRIALFLANVRAQDLEYQMRFAQYWAALPNSGANWVVAGILFCIDHHVLPAAFLHGVLAQYAHSLALDTFLLGHLRDVGTWYYFLFAMLVKTPVATELALLGAIGVGVYLLKRHWPERPRFVWPAACIVVPVGVHLASAMTAGINIGLRHIILVYPFAYVAAGALLAFAIKRWGKRVVIPMILLGVMLAVESLWTYPNYIAYFNFPAGGSQGGIRLLGDSNLDWGQDLPLLAQWEKDHPDAQVALAYFGLAPAEAYGVQAITLPAYPPPKEISDNFVMAVSATHLQGIHTNSFIGYQNLSPTQVLGGTIYLYDRRMKR
jgi:hypothetical protein